MDTAVDNFWKLGITSYQQVINTLSTLYQQTYQQVINTHDLPIRYLISHVWQYNVVRSEDPCWDRICRRVITQRSGRSDPRPRQACG